MNLLQDTSSIERQERYKAAVPFVHVPEELLAQWDAIGHQLKEQAWFRDLFPAEVQELLRKSSKLASRLTHLPDVPEVFQNKAWLELVRSAQGALVRASDLSE